MNKVKRLQEPGSKYRIMKGGPYGPGGSWTTEVLLTLANGKQETHFLTHAELQQWRKETGCG